MISLLQHHKIKKAQKQVDFLIPFLDIDRRYFLDPSLLRFSRSKILKTWNNEINDFLKLTSQVVRSGDEVKIRRLLNIGEAGDAGLGYCADGVSGSGVGEVIAENIMNILRKNPLFLKAGFVRLEELQWLDKNIGPDRISDLAINILKRHIISYTQKQCAVNRIPVEDVRVDKVFYPDTLEWGSLKTKMPVNPFRRSRDLVNHHPPQLLLPKEAVKMLPLFLNYDDFYGFVDKDKSDLRTPKPEVVKEALSDPKISTDYIKYRETETEELIRPDFDQEALNLLEELDEIKAGDRKKANRYREIVAKLLEGVFPRLAIFDQERSTLLGDQRRDVIFENNYSDGIFLRLKNMHKADLIVVDAKNTEDITPKDIARVSDYLNDRIGRVAIIVLRSPEKKADRKHAHRQYVDNNKIILFISDEDLKRWIRGIFKIQHETGKGAPSLNPEKALQRKYRVLLAD